MISNAVLSIKSGLTDFRTNILLRLVLILCTMLLLAGVYHAEPFLLFSMIGIAILLSIQIYFLFCYMQSTQREM